YHNLGFQLSRLNQRAEAVRWYRAALAAMDRLAADVPAHADVPSFRANRAGMLNHLGMLLVPIGQSGAAEKLLRQAGASPSRLADDFPANASYVSDLGRTLEWLGGVVREQGRLDESLEIFREAVRRQRAALALRPKCAAFRELCWKHQAQVADTLLRAGRIVETADAAREVARLAPNDPTALLRTACLFTNCAARAQPNYMPWGIGLALRRALQLETVALVRQAIASGLPNATRVLADPFFDPVRDCDAFRRLLREVNARRGVSSAFLFLSHW